ncbi:MAG: glycoside hydrolase family 2 protein [Bacteroidales bacterium]|nr:glycoside hydrolase family 2 protein [Bacteroidales bacterium]
MILSKKSLPGKRERSMIWLSRFLLIFILPACNINDAPLGERFELMHNWEFSQSGQEEWNPAIVPGTVHTDLLKNNQIPDPFYGCNEKNLQWIGQTDWVYRTTFQVDASLLEKSKVNLVFEGLDTYAVVSLNDNKILEANNMFRKWEINCKEFLKEGGNVLEIIFESAENRFLQDSIALGYPLPGGRWNQSRKAAYHFGWDWGPKFVTAGIWKPVYLEAWDSHKVEDIHVVTKSVTNQKADLQSTFTVESARAENASLRVINAGNGQQLAAEEIKLEPGVNEYALDFSIINPILWWTNGLGEQHLYELEFVIETASGKTFEQSIPYGIRTLEVVTEDDEFGNSLYVKLNNVPVFMKGANYIPQHSFVTEVQDEDYQAIIDMAVASNMNMLRVWGGGIYEKDIFYELCNRHGLLVWHDFMFACAMYPGHNAFVENVRQEAIYQVKRLRNHSNIALWCGNNEADEGWHNWQWQRTLDISPKDSATIWEGYKRVFHDLLPGVVNKYDPQRTYLSTSPMHGWGREESLKEGSAHYWGVWWGLQPFEMYLEKVPRFMSEYGFQAMPALATIRQFQEPEDDFLFSDPLKCHQKHPTGYHTISTYLERENLYPESVQEFIYLSQMVQAKGIGLAIEAHRRVMPRCMGTLYWQLNDCWPVTSWSATDVNGNWKALQYKVRDLYDDIIVSVIEHQDSLKVFLVSDRLEPTSGNLYISLVNFEGQAQVQFSEPIVLETNKSTHAFTVSSSELRENINPAEWLVRARFETLSGEIYQNEKFLETLGNLNLPLALIDYEIQSTEDGYLIKLTSNAFAAHVQLYLSDSHAWFDDNFFHLWPGEEKVVFCNSTLSLMEFESQLNVCSLRDYLMNN